MKKPSIADFQKMPDQLGKIIYLQLQSEDMRKLINNAQNKYMGWEKFQYQKTPKEFSIEEAWICLTLKRASGFEKSPIKIPSAQYFKYCVTKEHQRMLSIIDSQTSGAFASEVNLPEGKQRDRLVINGLMEEAINSSQLEGASTSRDVAKKMIKSGRNPRNESEAMILNNFYAMERIEAWKTKKLDEEFLLELHSILTKDTLSEDERGKFRTDTDNVVVSDPVTGEVFHRAPPADFLSLELENLYEFANNDSDEEYIHPVLKAIFIHFWIGYLHPFTDGNGRTARVLFYWYLIKKDYWLFKYITTSKTIKASKKSYGEAYVLAEQKDELDLGYFIQYILRTTLLSIDDFKTYLKRKVLEEKTLREELSRNDLNERQLDMLNYLNKGHGSIDIEFYKKRYNLVYESARRDLSELEDKKLVKKRKSGRKFLFENV